MKSLKKPKFMVLGLLVTLLLVQTKSHSTVRSTQEEFNEKTLTEYPLLKEVQNQILDLQLFELSLKNRKNPLIEEPLRDAIAINQEESLYLQRHIRDLKEAQQAELQNLILLAQKYSEQVSVPPSQFSDLLENLPSLFQASSAMVMRDLKVKTISKKSLYLAQLDPIVYGPHIVYRFKIPHAYASFWNKAQIKMIDKKFDELNSIHSDAFESLAQFKSSSYQRLFHAFDLSRYSLLQKIHKTRMALKKLSQTNTTMNLPQQYSGLFNDTLENLFSFGIDMASVNSNQNFEIKGILFSDKPEEARQLLNRLKFSSNTESSFNTPNL